MQALICPFCSGTVETDGVSAFGKCKYCRREFSVKNAYDMAAASDADRENIVKWRKELIANLDITERSQKRRDYSVVKHFALKILSVIPGDFQSRYFSALGDYKSDNDAPYIDFLKNQSCETASGEDKEFVSGKIIEYAEKKHEQAIIEFFTRIYGDCADAYILRAQKSIAEYIKHLRLTGVRDCDVFICHSSVDEAEAQSAARELENAGLSCWLAERNLLPGTQNYEEELKSAVEHCKMLLFLSSANSVYSKECEKELRMANADGKLFFAVKLDNEPYYGTTKNILSSVQWLNAFDGVAAHGDEIASAVKMVFADDDKERAELERRALEARKRAAENARQVQPQQIITRGGAANADVYLTQIEAWATDANDAFDSLEKGNALVDKGLADNPQNAELWLWKHIVSVSENIKENGIAFEASEKWAELSLAAHKNLNAAIESEYARFLKKFGEFPAPKLSDDRFKLLNRTFVETLVKSCRINDRIVKMTDYYSNIDLPNKYDVPLRDYILVDAAALDTSLLSGIYIDKAESLGSDETRAYISELRKTAKSKHEAEIRKAEAEVEKAEKAAIEDTKREIDVKLQEEINRLSEPFKERIMECKRSEITAQNEYYSIKSGKKLAKKCLALIVLPCIAFIVLGLVFVTIGADKSADGMDGFSIGGTALFLIGAIGFIIGAVKTKGFFIKYLFKRNAKYPDAVSTAKLRIEKINADYTELKKIVDIYKSETGRELILPDIESEADTENGVGL